MPRIGIARTLMLGWAESWKLLVMIALAQGALAFTATRTVTAAVAHERADFAESLARAGWTGSASANGIKLSARNVAIGSQAMLDLVTDPPRGLTGDQREALRDVVRFEVSEPGWLMGSPVEEGRYSLGMVAEDGKLSFEMYDAQGARRGATAFWIYGTTEELPSVSAADSFRAAKLQLNIGGISFTWRFVPRKLHDEILGEMRELRREHISIYSDLTDREELEALADECEKSLKPLEKRLGGKVKESHFDLYLLSKKEAYEAIDELVTGGEFQGNLAMTGNATRTSYIHPKGPIHASEDFGSPLEFRALVIHELQHQVARVLYPRSYPSWPVWLKEGLAELSAAESLGKRSGFEELMRGQWIHYALSNRSPELEEVLAWDKDLGQTLRYVSSYCLVSDLGKKSTALHKLFAEFEESSPKEVEAAMDDFVGKNKVRLRAALRNEWNGKPKVDDPSACLQGYLDTAKNLTRVRGSHGAPGMVIHPALVKGREVTVRTEIAFSNGDNQQADLYLGYRWEGKDPEFLKLGVLTEKLVLFYNVNGKWKTLSEVGTEKLAVAEPGEPLVWHELEVTWTASAIEVSAGGQRASFEVSADIPDEGRLGFGCYDSTVYFKPLEVEKR